MVQYEYSSPYPFFLSQSLVYCCIWSIHRYWWNYDNMFWTVVINPYNKEQTSEIRLQMVCADIIYHILHFDLNPLWQHFWKIQYSDWLNWLQRWWQDHCHDKAPCSSISKKYESISWEKYLFCNRNWQICTFTKTIEMLREFIIVVVVTARFRPGWPSQNVKGMFNIQINSNEIFWGGG